MESNIEKDRKLVEAAKQNPEEFAALYEKYIDQVYRYVFRRVQNVEQTEDLVSQTFFDALSHLKSYEFRGYAFSAWLYKIAHNNVLRWYKDNSKVPHSVEVEEAHDLKDEKVDIVEELDEGIEKSVLMAALDSMDFEDRELIRLKYFEEATNIEMAQIMGVTANNLGVRLYRALKKLKLKLESDNINL